MPPNEEPPSVLPSEPIAALRRGDIASGIELLRLHLREHPAAAGPLNAFANALQATGWYRQANAVYALVIETAPPPLQWRVASNYLVGRQYQPEPSEAELVDEARALAQLFGDDDFDRAHARAPRSGTPLRVGFVSADLCSHPVGLFLLPLLRALDRRLVTPLLFDAGSRPDHVAGELRLQAPRHDISALARDELVAWLRRFELDVVVDLSGHTAGNRLPALARRVAPVQLSWLGYFATTGLQAIDAVLMDPLHVPPGAEQGFTERVVRMPSTRFCYEPVPFAPAPADAPALARGYVTFGSFNNTAKYTEAVFDTWAAVLHKVPQSRLLLKWSTFAKPGYRTQVEDAFSRRGVAPERLELRGASVHRDLLREYADVDIALDPFPFSGGLTSCEALWMGLPVVTLPGNRAVSRQTLCFIANLGEPTWLQDWVATDAEDYVRKAAQLAADRQALAQLRRRLRPAMAASPLADRQGFADDWTKVVRSLCAIG